MDHRLAVVVGQTAGQPAPPDLPVLPGPRVRQGHLVPPDLRARQGREDPWGPSVHRPVPPDPAGAAEALVAVPTGVGTPAVGPSDVEEW